MFRGAIESSDQFMRGKERQRKERKRKKKRCDEKQASDGGKSRCAFHENARLIQKIDMLDCRAAGEVKTSDRSADGLTEKPFVGPQKLTTKPQNCVVLTRRNDAHRSFGNSGRSTRLVPCWYVTDPCRFLGKPTRALINRWRTTK